MKKVTNFYCDYVINGEKDKWTRLLVFEDEASFEDMKKAMLNSLYVDFAQNFKVLEYRLREEVKDETVSRHKVALKNKIINSFFAEFGTDDILNFSQKFAEKAGSEYKIYFIDKNYYLEHQSDIPYKARFYRNDEFGNIYFGIKVRDLFYESTVAEYIIEHNDDFGFPELREILDKYNK